MTDQAIAAATLTATRYTSYENFRDDVGGVVLDEIIEGTCLDELRDAGAGTIIQRNSATQLAQLGDVIAWDLDDGTGPVRVAATLTDVPGATRDRIDIDPDEEAAERTTIQGPNHHAVWTRGRMRPPGGVDRFPEADTVSFDWTYPGYTVTPDWVAANVLCDWATMHALVLFLSSGLFDIAPDFSPDGRSDNVGLIAPQAGDLASAPDGDWYFIGEVSFPADGFYTLRGVSDDSMSVWVDGIPFMTNSGWAQSTKRTEFFTAGNYHVAGHVHNYPPNAFFSQNPTYAGIAAFTGAGELEGTSPVWNTDSSWITLDYPPEIPGMTVGEALLLMRQQQIDRGATWASLVTPTFDKFVDSNGTDWPLIHSLTATCGRDSCFDFIKKVMSYAADVTMDADSWNWNAYVFGTLNPDSDVVLARGENLTHLSYHEEAIVAESLLTRSDALGWHDEGSGDTEGYLEIGSERTGAEVDNISDQVIDDYGRTRKAGALAYVARRGASPSELPYINGGFVKGANITFPDEDESPLVDRVLSITLTASEAVEDVGVALNIKDYLADDFERILQDLRS